MVTDPERFPPPPRVWLVLPKGARDTLQSVQSALSYRVCMSYTPLFVPLKGVLGPTVKQLIKKSLLWQYISSICIGSTFDQKIPINTYKRKKNCKCFDGKDSCEEI